MMLLDKSLVRMVESRLQKALSDLDLSDLKFKPSITSIRYGSDITVKINFSPEIDKEDFEPISEPFLKAGLAPSNYPIKVKGKNATVLRARRKKYLFVYDDEPNKQWVINFDLVSNRL